jgi:2-oxoisovalerate dehydrogenase E2 component (dihydrolipoyl transacylase)
MTDFQKGMQKSMTESNTIPHFYLKEEIDLTILVTLIHLAKLIFI